LATKKVLSLFSITEAAERLDISASTVKWYADRFSSYLSPSKGKGRKRFTPEDLATLQKIHELSQDHTTEEVEAMLEVSGEANITMYRSDALTTALDVLTSRMKAAMEDTIRQQLEGSPGSAEKAADLAISKLMDSLGSNTELNLWIDQQFKKSGVKSLTEAKALARQIQKAIIRRWKEEHT